jgi:uncharacterized protein
MRKFFLIQLLAGMLVSGLVHAASAQDAAKVDPARVAAAKELMDVTGVSKQMDGMIAAMAQGFRKGAEDNAGAAAAEAATKQFERFMAKLMSYRQPMLDEFANLYAERFTLDELKSVTDFYKSPTGQKFIQEIPSLMQTGSQIGIKYSQKALQDLKAPGP